MGITLDYYRILLKDAISHIPYSAIYGDPAAFPNELVLNSAGTLSESISLGSECPAYTSPTCGYVLQESVNTGFITTETSPPTAMAIRDTSAPTRPGMSTGLTSRSGR